MSILIVGTTSTTTVLKIGKKHPSGAVPLTVYVVVTVGVTVILVLLLPLLHVYEFAPLAVNVTGVPGQTAFVPLTTIGGAETETVIGVAHPNWLETVNVAEVVGVKGTPLVMPPDQT